VTTSAVTIFFDQI